MDGPGVPRELLWQNLRELDFLNRNSGGHSATIRSIKKLITGKNKTWSITDLGCGSGDTLVRIARWAHKHQLKVVLTGVDNNPDAIALLRVKCSGFPEINGIVSDYREFLENTPSTDIIISTLFCHHLDDPELVWFFQKLHNHVNTGFVINDLIRNRLAYYGAKLMTSLLNGSVLSKNDGPVSVLRGFKRKELDFILQEAGVRHYHIYRRWCFRFLIIGRSVGQPFPKKTADERR